jgi:hypothetical protein
MNGENAAHLEVDALREEVERLESALRGDGQGVERIAERGRMA